MPAKPGKCFLVGAGPGDLGLVTLRAKQLVEQANVIFYDALCNPEILACTREDVAIVFAGKRAGEHVLSQDEINALLVERARHGKAVVRMKGGDPSVFGRGRDEATTLTAAATTSAIVRGAAS